MGRKTTEVKCHFHYISKVHAIVDVNHGYLAKAVFVSVFNYKVTLPHPFPSCTHWKEVIMHNPHLKSEVVAYLHKLLGSLLNGRLVYFVSPYLSQPFSYLFTQFLIAIWTNQYLTLSSRVQCLCTVVVVLCVCLFVLFV